MVKGFNSALDELRAGKTVEFNSHLYRMTENKPDGRSLSKGNLFLSRQVLGKTVRTNVRVAQGVSEGFVRVSEESDGYPVDDVVGVDQIS